jgi:hypothetical protein
MASYCKVPECGWFTEEPVEAIAGCLATWHVYEKHRDVWDKVLGDRPPRDPDPRTPEGMKLIALWLVEDLLDAP